MTERTKQDGWIIHDGKGMPVDPEAKVIVRFRDGSEEDEGDAESACCWGDGGYSSNWNHSDISLHDIIAYRLVTA